MTQSLNLGQIITSGTGTQGSTPGATDAYFDTLLSYTLASAATQVVPVGIYFMLVASTIKAQMQVDSSGTNWMDYIAIACGGVIVSDGTNVRLINTSASEAVNLVPKM